MKINWNVRLRSLKFWLYVIGFLGAIATATFPQLGLTIDLSSWENWASDLVTIIFLGLTGLGIIVDPTTPKTGDSTQALSYQIKSKNQKLQDQVNALRDQLSEQQVAASQAVADAAAPVKSTPAVAETKTAATADTEAK